LRENVGPVLAAHFRGNVLAGNALYVDPVAAFIAALLPVVKEKVNELLKNISDEPRYLSRFIVQLMEFDDNIRQKFSYDAGNPEFGWKGLTWDILDAWFDRWSQVEKDFALERYQQIITYVYFRSLLVSNAMSYEQQGIGSSSQSNISWVVKR
jgi:hypothetical protein